MANYDESQQKRLPPPESGIPPETTADKVAQYALVGASAVYSYLFFKYGAEGGYGDEIGVALAGVSAGVGSIRIIRDSERVQNALARLEKTHAINK